VEKVSVIDEIPLSGMSLQERLISFLNQCPIDWQ
jgi:hypothetical protein